MHVQIRTSISRSAYQFDTAIDASYMTTTCNIVELEKRHARMDLLPTHLVWT